MPIRIVCVNPRQKNGNLGTLYRKDLDVGCEGCHIFYGKMGKHWTEDIAKCRCPLDVSYRDKIDYYPAKYKRVRKYSRK